jgi:peptidoglycan/LPS O-acetylase OafA/YrhL
MRTLPLYWMFFAASAFVTIYGLTLDKAWTAGCWAYLLFLQNFAWPLLVPWYHESWSLAIEEWFYLIFPLAFASTTIVGCLSARSRVLLVAVVLAIVPLIARIFVYDPAKDIEGQVGHLVVLRLDSIAFGILAICAVSAFPRLTTRWKYAIAIVGIFGVIFSIEVRLGNLSAGNFYLHTFLFTVISASFAAIVIWANAQNWAAFENRLGAGIVRWFSSRSYALYLCHGSVVKTMLHHELFALPVVMSFAVFVLCSVVIAESVHRLIELPVMNRRPREKTGGAASGCDLLKNPQAGERLCGETTPGPKPRPTIDQNDYPGVIGHGQPPWTEVR